MSLVLPVTPVLMAKPANEHDHAYCGFCAPLRTVRHLAAAYARPQGQSLLGFEPWDITEIKGADELYGADGIIAQSEANATRLFGTVHTYYSTELVPVHPCNAVPCTAAAPAAGQRPVLLAARNAHKALLYARRCWILISSGSGLRRRMPVHFAAARCQLQN